MEGIYTRPTTEAGSARSFRAISSQCRAKGKEATAEERKRPRNKWSVPFLSPPTFYSFVSFPSSQSRLYFAFFLNGERMQTSCFEEIDSGQRQLRNVCKWPGEKIPFGGRNWVEIPFSPWKMTTQKRPRKKNWTFPRKKSKSEGKAKESIKRRYFFGLILRWPEYSRHSA